MFGKKRIIVAVIIIICYLVMFTYKSMAQNVVQHGKTFVQQVDSTKKTAKEPVLTGYTYVDSKGQSYPIYMSSTGKCFIIRTSKKTGKQYRQYLPEITKKLTGK